MSKRERDIFTEARRRVPLEKHPTPQPMPKLDPTVLTTRYEQGSQAAATDTYVAALSRVLEAARQLHEKEGPVYDKWLRAMRKVFSARRRRKKGGS